MSRADRGRAKNPHWQDFSGTWIGPLLVVNQVPPWRRRGGTGGTHAVWRCHDHDTGRDIHIRTAELKRLQREREAELAAHREWLASEAGERG